MRRIHGSRTAKGLHTFAVHKNIRTAAKQRLIREGRYDDYRSFVEAIKLSGIPDSGDMAAWKIALFAFAPITGGTGELKADPYFEEIAAKWSRGEYPDPPGFAKFPSGMTNFEKLADEPSPEFKATVKKVKQAKGDWENEWQELASKVDPSKETNEVEVIRWVFDHCGLSADRIDPDEVPSVGAVRMLRHASTESGYRDFLGAWLKLLPDRKTVEHEARWRDDGRDLDLLEDFEKSLATEENAA